MGKEQMYLIWNHERSMWWNADRVGYTEHRSRAGRYTHEEAREICEDANKYHKAKIQESMVPVGEKERESWCFEEDFDRPLGDAPEYRITERGRLVCTVPDSEETARLISYVPEMEMALIEVDNILRYRDALRNNFSAFTADERAKVGRLVRMMRGEER